LFQKRKCRPCCVVLTMSAWSAASPWTQAFRR
jgi:hypothetical protein